ncbi:hypothetical protein ENSA5_02270 [Enhygromyxa salina]|uniref:Uncharacterized protein n=1 Tax=Enhygromyxa salina TaxID=215803 RepID=A0A2S9YK71_9BACT|nr:hypothetical protein ENSA5_02270 [Enhygromyxa salina]
MSAGCDNTAANHPHAIKNGDLVQPHFPLAIDTCRTTNNIDPCQDTNRIVINDHSLPRNCDHDFTITYNGNGLPRIDSY